MNTIDPTSSTEIEQISKPITVRLHPEELAKVERYAKEDHRTRASFLRVMTLRGLAAYEKEYDTTIASTTA
ncbi:MULTISPECIES: hypothetical protein [unclassified Undibacterium]|uniref:hypothetical protein n=1 Tax=unclassified Undibacterium TaxID=2630295 RepID=UPI002AC8B0AF|nr:MULTISPECIES: hypothetical protein [unclassified Undibacterium]MEB0137975.1 hypothetical protein [Undibacterium sp. CCC2.1]MEB0170692.1 hypothetical protein [Undibacterium sp. CCC1.1]MEB0177033.1 hypothetical protein [Undibacterium sp. CCC3.4]MEB0216322.1 hypothetical protein [Undibacterium sp. 5I2]WPX42506.1 hypothetical protein RHM61_14055 [Undibacterium sp. CCC3.4]